MRISGKKGILSLLLSLVLVLELILSSGQIVLASSENHQDVYTVKILNEQGESVPGVKVVYDLYTDATGSDKKQETVDAVTGDDGVLEIAAISEAQQADGEAYYKIVEASGEGYDSYNDTEMQTITSENVLTEREITLKKTVQKQKVTLTGLVTNVQNSQPLENVFVSDGDAGSTITGSDGTYSIELIEGNSYELTFSLDGYDEVSKTVKDVPLENITTEVNNQTYSIKVENLEEDGVYTLSCTAKDWANNEYNKFTLDDGQEYENVTFSVNRNGSTFLIDNNTEKMLDKYYVYSVENPVVIKEINTDPIEKYVVKLNGTELEAGEDYITENVNNEGEWNERTYTINKKLFEGEGEYSIVVESTDKAETASYSDIKGLDVSWIVDQTAPVVAVSGLENSGRYKTESQTVTAIPTDDGGKLKSFKAVVADKSGTVKKNNELEGKVLVDLSGEELDTYLGENDGKITFNIPEGLEEQVQIICTDYAVHEDGKTTNEYNEVFSRVTVSANSVIIFYANKPLFYGTIIGIVLTAGGIFLIVWKRKKKKAEGTYKK